MLYSLRRSTLVLNIYMEAYRMFFDPLTNWLAILLSSGLGLADEHEKNKKADKYIKERKDREQKKCSLKSLIETPQAEK